MTSINCHRLKSLLHRLINPNVLLFITEGVTNGGVDKKNKNKNKKRLGIVCISPSKASDTISYFAETVISGLACQLAVNFTSPALLSDTGGDVRGCLSGSPGLNTELLMSPASEEEEEEDGVLLLLLLLLYMIFVSLISPVRSQLSVVRRE